VTAGRPLRALLDSLGQGLDASRLELEEAACRLGRFVCAEMEGSRVSVWSMRGAPGARVLRRRGGFDATTGRCLDDRLALREAECRLYFAALARDGIVACADSRDDPAFDAMLDRWLRPRDALALLDVVIGVNGHVLGVLRCEQHARPRAWTPQDLATAKRIAAEVALRRARRHRQAALVEGWA
jgi:GAF domain-containing protein